MNLTRKFTFGLIGGVMLVQAGFGVIRVYREQALFRLDIAREEQVLARALALSAEAVILSNDEEAGRDLIDKANLPDSHVLIRWVDLDEHGPEATRARADRAALHPLWSGVQVSIELGDEDAAVYTYAPITLPNGRLAAVEVTDSLHDEAAYMRQSVVNALLSTSALVILCGAVAWLVGLLFIGRPVRALVAQARYVGKGELSRRISLEQRDELGELAHEMNEMCAALETAHARAEHATEAKVAAVEQLKHVDRLRTVGTLASGVAHELGTPLNVVDGHAQLIREDPGASGETKEHAGIISRQAKRMTRIIRQLLDFARREQTQDAQTEIIAVAQRALEMAEPLAKKRGVELSLAPHSAMPLARISAEELTQVLVNVVINGVQAMPDGGHLSIAADTVNATAPWSLAGERAMVRLIVEDEGVGMSADTAMCVFEPFFTTKDGRVGHCLDIQGCQPVLEQMAHGTVIVDDENEVAHAGGSARTKMENLLPLPL